MLNFWASWCGPCKAESPALERLWQRYRARGLVVLGIDTGSDAVSDARRFLAAHAITYPVVHDPNDLVSANTYGVADLPVTYVLDRRGRIVGAPILGTIVSQRQELERSVEVAFGS